MFFVVAMVALVGTEFVEPGAADRQPLAGLAAGLGLAALASHFGFGEELASFMMMALLAMVVIGVIGYFMRKKAAAQGNQGMQYAGAGAPFGGNAPQREFTPAGGSAAAPVANNAGTIPADFDVDGFVRNAKVNFIRLQAANDAGNLDDIREFTSPEMFAEIKMNWMEQSGSQSRKFSDWIIRFAPFFIFHIVRMLIHSLGESRMLRKIMWWNCSMSFIQR